MKYFTLVAIHATALALLTSCATTPYNAKPLYVLHKGERVTVDECISFDYFPSICSTTGTVLAATELKNKCYPNVTYTIQFADAYYAVYDFCALELTLAVPK